MSCLYYMLGLDSSSWTIWDYFSQGIDYIEIWGVLEIGQ